MLKREIKYVDYEGEERTEVHYFNLSQPEMIQMEVSKKGGLDIYIQRIVTGGNKKEMLDIFREIILLSHGYKSDDNTSFIKSQEDRNAFEHSLAYETLYMELFTDADLAAAFITGIMPKK
jgi:hypothetical protein